MQDQLALERGKRGMSILIAFLVGLAMGFALACTGIALGVAAERSKHLEASPSSSERKRASQALWN